MGAQNRYGHFSPVGAAGGIVDIAPYAIDTFLNEEETGVLGFGMGVVKGSKPGSTVALPEGSVAKDFEGIVVNNRTTEYDMEGKVSIKENASVGVMRYGRIYVRVATGAEPAYGDKLYMVVSGDEAGYFTNVAESAIEIKGRFLGSIDSASGVVAVELFNQAQA